MKPLGLFLATASVLGTLPASAQITVELADLQMTSGVQRSFLTHQGNVTVVNGLILGTGGPSQWDFSAGVGDETYHYEILPADQSPFSDPFTGAKLTEVRTVDSDGGTALDTRTTISFQRKSFSCGRASGDLSGQISLQP